MDCKIIGLLRRFRELLGVVFGRPLEDYGHNSRITSHLRWEVAGKLTSRMIYGLEKIVLQLYFQI